MQEALTGELERRCGNPECGNSVAGKRRQYCSAACAKKVSNARGNARNSLLVSKICKDCNHDKPIEDFRPPRSPRCLPCLQKKRKDEYKQRGGKEYIYGHNLKQYGLTLDEYRSMLAAQGGRCAICSKEPPTGKRLNVDHNHETGATRELLCRWCNYALGNAKDDPARLRAMADYLERHAKPEPPERIDNGDA